MATRTSEMDPPRRILFKPIRVSHQDLCRYYKVDFWASLFRTLRVKDKLAHKLFRRRLRRPKRFYRLNKARACRFEVLKLDDYRFVPRNKIPAYFHRIHNMERFRLYFGFTELGLRNFFMPKRRSGLRLRSFLYEPRLNFLRNRPD